MTNFWKQPFKKIGEALSGAAKIVEPVAQIASVIPGPWQLPGQIITAAGALTGGSSGGGASDIQAQTNQLMQQGADAQMAYQMAALQQYQNNLDRQLVTATADKQMAYDVSRGQYLANQGNALPYQQASLSALQSLPMLQQLLGVPAYNIGKTINQYTPPAINYSDLYSGQAQQMSQPGVGNTSEVGLPNISTQTAQKAAQEARALQAVEQQKIADAEAQRRAAQPGAAIASQQGTGMASGIRLSRAAPTDDQISYKQSGGFLSPATYVLKDGSTYTAPTVQLKQPTTQPTTQPVAVGKPIPTTEQITSRNLTPYTGETYDLNNSPLFQWQKKIADEGLTAQLAASGLSDSTYAQRELSRQNQAITAAERERVVGNLQSLTSLGMSGSQLGQAQFSTPQMGGVSDIYGNAAQQLAAFQGNMGQIQGQLASQQAQNAMAAYNAQAKQPSGLQTALELASSYGWLGGNKTPQIPSAMSNPYVNSAMTNANPFRLF